MKIKIKREFHFQVSVTKVGAFPPGVYDVPGDMSIETAESALKFGGAKIVVDRAPPKVVEKKAPENKVVEVTANKASVEKPAVRRRSTRSKSDA